MERMKLIITEYGISYFISSMSHSTCTAATGTMTSILMNVFFISSTPAIRAHSAVPFAGTENAAVPFPARGGIRSLRVMTAGTAG